MKIKFIYKLVKFDESETHNHERLASRHRGKYQSALRKLREKASHPLTMDSVTKTTGTQEMETLRKGTTDLIDRKVGDWILMSIVLRCRYQGPV